MIASHRDPRMDKPSERLLAVHLMVPMVARHTAYPIGKGLWEDLRLRPI